MTPHQRESTMSTVHDCIELALRLEQLRQAPPAPLIRRQRDGPGYPDPKPVPERRSGPPGTPQRHPSGIDYRSKKVKP